jgi:inward rectifier potassium channel
MGNQRSNLVAVAQLRLSKLRNEIGAEGIAIRRLLDLTLMCSESPTFVLTWNGFHVIDERSPLRHATPETL